MNFIYQKPPSTSTPRRVVSGRYLAHGKLSPRERAELAADLIDGRAALGKLTAKQLITLCRANASYVHAARQASAVTVQETTLAETLAAASPEELVRELGAHKLWAILEHATA
jgi:hypothetical protein